MCEPLSFADSDSVSPIEHLGTGRDAQVVRKCRIKILDALISKHVKSPICRADSTHWPDFVRSLDPIRQRRDFYPQMPFQSCLETPTQKENPKMPTKTLIRSVTEQDVPDLKTIIDTSDLFPSDMLDGMISDYFENEASRDIWITCGEDRPMALAYCAPEQMTEGTWNLYLIAVHADCQGGGYGTSLVDHLESMLASRGERILLVETSGLPDFERTRAFYRKCGYEEEARIRDFYQPGDDKVVFRKVL